MKFKRKIIDNGGALYLNMPPEISENYGLRKGTPMILKPEEKKKGKFIAIFRAIDEIKEKESVE